MDAMLDAMTPEEFDERWAASQIPTPDRRLTAHVAATLHNLLEVILTIGGKREPKLRTPEEYLGEPQPKTPAWTEKEIERFQDSMAAQFGVSK